MVELIRSFRDLRVDHEMFALQQAVSQAGKKWPAEEKFALTDQARRSSRSMGANVAEAWAKRRYPAHFVSKLTDADGEIQETSHWLASAAACGYITAEPQTALQRRLTNVGGMLGQMMSKPEAFVPRS